jgi:ferredoxin--NADP+ reductase
MKKYLVLANIQKSHNTFCLRVERPKVVIKSGQCFNVGMPGMDINREYSMYSGADVDYLEFLIREVDNGLVSSRLRKLQVGDVVEIDGPYGEFCIPDHRQKLKLVFVASGTGIAPFHSFVKTYPNIDYTLIHGIRYPDEVYDVQDYKVGSYIPCISSNNGKSFRVTDYLRQNRISKDSMVYLCGNRNMIIDSVQILLDQGIGGDQIVSEVFF